MNVLNGEVSLKLKSVFWYGEAHRVLGGKIYHTAYVIILSVCGFIYW